MKTIFAVLNNNIVENIFEGDGKIDFEHQIVSQIYPNCKIIECNSQTGFPILGGDLYKKKFRPPKPHNSWKWVSDEWVAPINPPKSSIPLLWDEAKQNWTQINFKETAEV